MLKNLLAQLFGKTKEPEYIDEIIWVDIKKRINVKKAFCTVRFKNGETAISKEFIGLYVNTPLYHHELAGSMALFYDKKTVIGHQDTIFYGKQVLLTDFGALRGESDNFIQITNDRLVRISDIMDFIGIQETDHEIEVDAKESKILRRLK